MMKFCEYFLKESQGEEGGEEGVEEAIKVLSQKWDDEGIFNFMAVHRNGDIFLTGFVVPKELRGRGVGAAKVRELQGLAKAYGRRIVLSPDKIENAGTTSKGRLIKFYKSLGFRMNRGRSRDYRISDSMIWEV